MTKKAIALGSIIGILSTVSVAFADNTAGAATAGLLQMFVKAMSLLWIVPAVIAGKLMTNSFVMGEVIGIDEYLFRFWTIMMIIANIGVAGVLVKMVIDGINEGKLVEKLKSSIGTIIIGIIGIQLSWFGVTTLIDIANVAVAGVGQQMNQYIGESFKTDISTLLSKDNFDECVRMSKSDANNPTEGTTREKCGLKDYEGTTQDRIDNFVNNSILHGNSLSGPLIFLGLGIYKFTDYGNVKNPKISMTGVTMFMLVQLVMIFFTFVPMRVLMLINFLRIGYIWMRLAFGPVIVLGWMYKELSGGKANLFGENGKIFDIGNIVALIFQPVISVIGIGLTVIFTMAMYQGMQPKDALNPKAGAVDSPTTVLFDKITWSTKGVGNDEQSSFGTDEGSFNLNGVVSQGTSLVGGGLGYLLITMFSIFIMWTTIKVTSGFAELTSEAVKNSIDNMKKIATKNIKVGEGKNAIDLDAGMKMMNVNTPLKTINDRLASLGRTQKDDYVEGVNKGSVGKLFGLDKVGDIRSDLIGDIKGGVEAKAGGLGIGKKFSDIKTQDDVKAIIKTFEGIQVPDSMGDVIDPKVGEQLNDIFKKAADAVDKNQQWETFKFSDGGAKQVLEHRYNNGGKQYIAVVHNRPEIMDLSFSEAMGVKGGQSLGWALGQMSPKKYPLKKLAKNSDNRSQTGNEIDFIKLLKNNKPDSRNIPK